MDPKILEEGCLVTCRMYLWNASVKIDTTALKADAPKAILRTMQDMILDKSTLKEMVQIKNRVYYHLNRPDTCLPFPIENVYCPFKEKITELDEIFKACETDYWKLVDKLIEEYEDKKNEFKETYPKYYKLIEKKYPSKEKLRSKFYFTYNFFQMAMPNKKLKLLSPNVYKREQEKHLNMVKEMEEMTISVIGSTLLERVKKLEDQCKNDSINAKTVQGVDNFLNNWENLWAGYIDEEKFKGIVETLRLQMKRVTADRLKDMDDFREKIGERLGKIVTRIEAIPNVELKRKLDL